MTPAALREKKSVCERNRPEGLVSPRWSSLPGKAASSQEQPGLHQIRRESGTNLALCSGEGAQGRRMRLTPQLGRSWGELGHDRGTLGTSASSPRACGRLPFLFAVAEFAASRESCGVSAGRLSCSRDPNYRDTGLRIGKAYRYTVTGFDQAGNAASKTIAVMATGPLLSPVPAARVGSTPLLVWTPVSGARYYNLQLVRGGRKILSLWPRHEHFQLPRSWVFDGHRYRLRLGVYRWYVWPGFGRFSAARYGRLLGGSSFVVVALTRAGR